ncbi:MAG: PepSY domain-containing protein, partial [Firmicutes bacterium]|nr:PepSY domain-containing protein [Bacillota bacterium]
SSSNGSTSGNTSGSSTTVTYISVDEAKSIALADAGVSSSNATFTKVKQDTDDGVVIYDVEFYTSTHEYDYEINAVTGAVIEKDVEALKTSSNSGSSSSNGSTSGNTSGSSTTVTYISVDEAKSIALADAGVSSSNATFTKVKQDTDDGVVIYDVEFYTTSYEYDYEINAVTGAVIERDVEARKASDTGSSSSTYIGVDAAKEIAVSHAGYSVSNVSFSKVKLDEDDGVVIYEIEFYVGNVEYEYEINAKTGAILEYDSEIDD